jgi:hypothetical protein
MKNLRARLVRWWRQTSLQGAHVHLSHQQLWGFNHATLSYVGSQIMPQLQSYYTGRALKSVVASLHTRSIDELVADLNIVQQTMEKSGYVDERLLYVNQQPISLHAYLALTNGVALNPLDAWRHLHNHALAIAEHLDLLLVDDDAETDRHYYLRRYGSVLQETYQVYTCFAQLAGLTLPVLSTP